MTIQQLLESTLPHDVAQRAIRAVKAEKAEKLVDMLNTVTTTKHGASLISSLFTWSNTPEGDKYWRAIASGDKTSTLTPIPVSDNRRRLLI